MLTVSLLTGRCGPARVGSGPRRHQALVRSGGGGGGPLPLHAGAALGACGGQGGRAHQKVLRAHERQPLQVSRPLLARLRFLGSPRLGPRGGGARGSGRSPAIGTPGDAFSSVPCRLRSGSLNRQELARTETAVKRYLFSLGQLLRHGAEHLDDQPEEGGVPTTEEASAWATDPSREGEIWPACSGGSCWGRLPPFLTHNSRTTTHPQMAALFVRVFEDSRVSPRVKEDAVGALMQLAVPKPLLLRSTGGGDRVVAACLSREAAPGARCRVLGGLSEMLRFEEQTLVSRQDKAAKDHLAAFQGARFAEDEERDLARENNEGEAPVTAGSVVQELWPLVLEVATDGPGATALDASNPGTPMAPSPLGIPAAGGGAAAAAQQLLRSRQAALDLMEQVLRGGHVVPFTAVSTLVALSTEPERSVARRALDQLRALYDKFTDLVDARLPDGVSEAFAFHDRIGSHSSASTRAPSTSPGAAAREQASRQRTDSAADTCSGILRKPRPFSAAGQRLVPAAGGGRRPVRGVLPGAGEQGLQGPPAGRPAPPVRCLRGTCGPAAAALPAASGDAAPPAGPLRHGEQGANAPPYDRPTKLAGLLQVLSELPYKRAEEPLSVVYQINQVIAKRADGVLTAMKRAWGKHGEEDGGAAPAAALSPVPGANPAAVLGSPSPAAGLGRRNVAEAQAADCRSSLALSLLLLLKRHLKVQYALGNDRIAEFHPSGPTRAAEEKAQASSAGNGRPRRLRRSSP